MKFDVLIQYVLIHCLDNNKFIGSAWLWILMANLVSKAQPNLKQHWNEKFLTRESQIGPKSQGWERKEMLEEEE